jgi:alkylated DNA repair dioxygenase AlkB
MWVHYTKESDNEYSLMIYIPNFLDNFELEMCNYWLQKKYENYEFCGLTEGEIYNEHNRKQIWYQENGEYFCKSWKNRYERWKSKDYDAYMKGLEILVSNKLKYIMHYDIWDNDIQLHNIKEICKDKLDISFNFNSILVNLYETGYEGISPHRDNIESFGMYPTIVGLSIGVTRTMRIKRIVFNEDNICSLKPETNHNKKGISMEIPLENNSLFIMMGSSQKYYTHEIVKEPEIKEKRFSFTFRKWQGT